MPRRHFEEGYYHIYNRGFKKMTILKTQKDYEKIYLKIIELLNKDDFKQIKILSYAFLPNHFHFIVNLVPIPGSAIPGLTISKFFGSFQGSYAKYFNIKNERKWQVFEWRFKAKLIDNEEYFEKCMAYVNFNPVKHWIIDKIEDWPYISLHSIIWDRRSKIPLSWDKSINFMKYKDALSILKI